MYQRRRGGREEKCNVAGEKEAIKSPACQDRCSSRRIRLSVARRVCLVGQGDDEDHLGVDVLEDGLGFLGVAGVVAGGGAGRA